MRSSSLLSLAASFSSALALYKGFNYGTASGSGTPFTISDYESFFSTAASLDGTDGEFTSARLYTMIQAGTQNTVVAALPAAQSTKTYLLLGLWGSGGQDAFNQELIALKTAIQQFGSMAPYIVGISIGSEDLYRISPTAAMQGNKDAGAEPDTLVSYISQARSALSGTAWANVPVGHVDTWTSWANSSNDAVANACDFVGVDAYPYFQNTESNPVSSGQALLESALNSLTPAAASKDVWITESGWPVSGPTENQAVPSLANAQSYWDTAGCNFAFAKYNTWWYTLQDYGSSPSFGVVGETLSSTPLYDLSCGAASNSGSSSSSSSSSAAVSPSNKVASSAPAASSSTKAPAATTSAAATTTPAPEEYGVTETVWQTFYETVTAETCCEATTPAGTITVKSTATVSITTGTNVPSASACPANIEGDYLKPELIIPVSSTSENTAYGTSYFASIDATNSTLFVFDIPQSYAGKQCSLIFLFPELSQLQTSSYTFNGKGGIDSHLLHGNANTGTTYANMPSAKLENGMISSVTPGNSYVISSASCPAGAQVTFDLSSINGLALNFFEDYNPSPLGVFVRAC